jgi:hypothetical protein
MERGHPARMNAKREPDLSIDILDYQISEALSLWEKGWGEGLATGHSSRGETARDEFARRIHLSQTDSNSM